MENEPIILTKEGLEKTEAELKNLIEVERPQIVEALKVARSYGDLSENADYSAAKERQKAIDERIDELTHIIENHKLVDSKGSADYVSMGSIVTLEDGRKFKIIGSVEVNPFAKTDVMCISNESPLGKAIYGKKVGDTIRVESKVPFNVKIKKIEGSK